MAVCKDGDGAGPEEWDCEGVAGVSDPLGPVGRAGGDVADAVGSAVLDEGAGGVLVGGGMGVAVPGEDGVGVLGEVFGEGGSDRAAESGDEDAHGVLSVRGAAARIQVVWWG